MKKILTLTAVGSVMLAAANAQASGFFLREQSVAGMGNAMAGATAGAEDISYSFWNPAGLTRHKGTQINGNLTTINPHIKSKAENGQKARHVVENAVLPSAYVSHQLNDQWTAALSITSPFGLVTDYSDNFPSKTTTHDTLSDVVTINLSPMLAYKANDKLSLGAGFNVQYIDATLKTNTAAGVGKIYGDTTDVGYVLGALYEFTDATRVGVGYRSEVKHKLKGDSERWPVPAWNGDISAKLTTPEVLTFGAYHDVNDKWSVMAEAQRTGWSSFESLAIKTDKALVGGKATPENWKDVWMYSLGASYKLDDQWKLRAGVAWDKAPVTDKYRTMRIPDSDRIWYSTGVEYKMDEKWTLNAGYTYIVADSVETSKTQGPVVDYKGNIHLFGVGVNYNF